MAADIRDRPEPWRVAGGVAAVGVLWAVLAALRPEVTYHLAPALVVWAGPYLAGRRASRALLATGASAGFALVVALLLAAADVFRGPAIVGGDALGEAIIVIASAAVIAVLGIGFRSMRSSPSRTTEPLPSPTGTPTASDHAPES